MKKFFFFCLCFVFLFKGAASMAGTNHFEADVFNTDRGDLTLTFIGHGSLMISFDRKIIHIDPVSQYADYATMPKADLILITHEHTDHLDLRAIEAVKKDKTELVVTANVARQLKGGRVLPNGAQINLYGFTIESVPAYNIVHMRSPGTPFHPKGAGSGYVITCADKRIYIAGDTENIPEIQNLQNIDIAFLPMNLPYTMTPEMVADAALAFRPKILYPYHYGKTETQKLFNLLKNEKDIEIRIRKMM